MRCKSCGAHNPDWNPNQSPGMMRFCVQCGAELESPAEDAVSTAAAASSAATAAAAAAAASSAASGSRKARSEPNLKFGGDLSPAPTLGSTAKTPPRPNTVPPPRPVPVSNPKMDWATDKAKAAPKEQTPKHSAVGWVIGILLVIALGVLGYNTIHDWTPATCAAPETCTICGRTRGKALEHTWLEATCTEPWTCSECGETFGTALGHYMTEATCTEPATCVRCGVTEGSAPGHDWAEATYDAPRTCRRCGETSGEVKGYIDLSNISESWADRKVSLDGWNVSIKELSGTVRNCNRLSFLFGFFEEPNSDYYGTWKVYVLTTDNEWRCIGTIQVDSRAFVPDNVYNDLPSYTLEIRPAVSFTAYTVLPSFQMDSFGGRYIDLESAQTYS